jgi:photosystem II stability/assembly factor-like uncharacterized protein
MSRLTSLSVAILALSGSGAKAVEPGTLSQLVHSTHIHGLAFDPQDDDRLLLATHDGLYAFDLETEELTPIGESRQDYMGFSVDPEGVFYGSGHPETGGNSGVITSTDGGVSWTLLSEGVNGPVDFHQLTVSHADQASLFGAYAGDLQHSHDAGVNWDLVGPAPAGLIDLAASALGPEVVYAATEEGLLKSEDAGETWTSAHPVASPVTFVEIGLDGELYAFVLETGLVRATEDSLDWRLVSERGGGEYLLHFATDGRRAVASTGSGTILISHTGGETWSVLAS